MIYWQDDALKLALNEMKIILPKNHPVPERIFTPTDFKSEESGPFPKRFHVRVGQNFPVRGEQRHSVDP
jgi:hypothetical protein